MPAVTRAREPLDDYGNLTGGANLAARLDDDEKSTLDSIEGKGGPLNADLRRASLGRARGLHDPAATYSAMDVVVHNGSEWRAVRDDPGALPGDGWVLDAKGSRGKRGPAGVHVTGIETVGYCIMLSLSNGHRLRANLLPMLELYDRERKP
jgi:hypothetical protein